MAHWTRCCGLRWAARRPAASDVISADLGVGWGGGRAGGMGEVEWCRVVGCGWRVGCRVELCVSWCDDRWAVIPDDVVLLRN